MIDIERLAREAGAFYASIDEDTGEEYLTLPQQCFQRFAALVRNEVLEEAAESCDGLYHQSIGPGYGEVRYGIVACASAIRSLKTDPNEKLT